MIQEDSPVKEWMKVIPESEQLTYRKAGFLGKVQLGKRSALILTDLTYSSTGSESLTLEEAIKEHPLACGPVAWNTMPRISRLIEMFRAKSLPIVYTRADIDNQVMAGTAAKTNRKVQLDDSKFSEFPQIVAPREGEWILGKTKASAFFQTPLSTYLVKEKVDTLIICGVATSGCVRATAIDAFSHGYATIVINDCCFDRSYFAHCTNLFDINAKYATVLSLHELENLM